MFVFYFLTSLFLMQVAYGLSLLGFHFSAYPMAKFLVDIYHPWGLYSRLLLVTDFIGFAPTSIKEIIQISRQKCKKIIPFLFIWFIILFLFVCYDCFTIQMSTHPSLFMMLFCLSFAPLSFSHLLLRLYPSPNPLQKGQRCTKKNPL